MLAWNNNLFCHCANNERSSCAFVCFSRKYAVLRRRRMRRYAPFARPLAIYGVYTRINVYTRIHVYTPVPTLDMINNREKSTSLRKLGCVLTWRKTEVDKCIAECCLIHLHLQQKQSPWCCGRRLDHRVAVKIPSNRPAYMDTPRWKTCIKLFLNRASWGRE